MEGTMKGQLLWKRILGSVVAGALVMGLKAGPAGAAKPVNKIRVAIGLNGPIRDMGFWASGHQGALKLKEDPGVAEVAWQEYIKNPDIEGVIRRWAVEGYDLIIGHGFDFGEPSRKLAAQFPKTVFAVAYFFKLEGHPNLITYGVQAEGATFLAGTLAALMSKSKKIGYMSGFPVPNTISAHNLFKLGARAAVPDIKMPYVFVDSWSDANKTKEAAIAMINQGVDVIWGTHSPGLMGGILAADEAGVHAIGTYFDIKQIAPNTVLTSVDYVWHTPMKKIIMALAKTGKPKQVTMIGVGSGGARLTPLHPKVPADVVRKVEAFRKDILAGKIKTPFMGQKLLD
jgi:basic membrane protein A